MHTEAYQPSSRGYHDDRAAGYSITVYTSINACVKSYFPYLCLSPLDCELSDDKEWILFLFAFPKADSECFMNKWMEKTVQKWHNTDLLKSSP